MRESPYLSDYLSPTSEPVLYVRATPNADTHESQRRIFLARRTSLFCPNTGFPDHLCKASACWWRSSATPPPRFLYNSSWPVALAPTHHDPCEKCASLRTSRRSRFRNGSPPCAKKNERARRSCFPWLSRFVMRDATRHTPLPTQCGDLSPEALESTRWNYAEQGRSKKFLGGFEKCRLPLSREKRPPSDVSDDARTFCCVFAARCNLRSRGLA